MGKNCFQALKFHVYAILIAIHNINNDADDSPFVIYSYRVE